MGLDTSHDCWHGPYSAFSRWRNMLAEAAGYQIVEVEDDHGWRWKQVRLNWPAITDDNLAGDWDSIPEDPLIILLAHYDHDGHIRAEHAKFLADRLDQLATRLPGSPESWMLGATLRFSEGLRRAAEAGEDVDFH